MSYIKRTLVGTTIAIAIALIALIIAIVNITYF